MIIEGILSSFRTAIPKALKTTGWLLKIILPISLIVSTLQYLGVLSVVAGYLSPVFSIIGLPGESAVVFISSLFLSLYAPIAIMATLPLDLREITILAIMCLIAHNLLVETAIQKKTGSSAIVMFSLRFVAAFVAAYVLNKLLPQHMGESNHTTAPIQYASYLEMTLDWLKKSAWLVLKIALIITGLLFLQNLLRTFNLIDKLSKPFSPFMKMMGLSHNTSFLWFIAQFVGLTYGAVVLIEEIEKGEINKRDADLLNYHIAINHSLLEDTLLFVAIGVPVLWITLPRIAMALIVVWTVRLFKLSK